MTGTAASTFGSAGTRRRHEGLAAGAIGATAVWAWLLVSDMHSRIPFSTPAFLGRGLLSVDAPRAHLLAVAGVIAFTIAHYALWMGVGALIMAAVRRAARAPSILLAVILLLILSQFLFVGVTAILAQGRLGAAAWRDLLIGDAIGWGAFAWYVLRTHTELRGELARASEGADG
jgi:hypothetical protein